ncbi:MAG: tRNA lysidine(34) synthetase TilS [Sedimentisphaerales bacterium]
MLAISGGADSTALLHAVHALKTCGILRAEFVCAHVNHQLRGDEADSDEQFVVAEAARLGLSVISKQVDVRGFARDHKLSIETAARQCRIKALTDVAKASHCNLVATAHQKNDNAETILHRLTRGTGFRGLAGIWPKRTFEEGVTFVRPMLCVTREEVMEYLQARNLAWRRDRTNADCTYKRNFIRHRLLPALQRDCSDPVVETLSELAQSALRFYDRVCRRVDETWPSVAECAAGWVILDLRTFQTEPLPVKVELIRRSLTCLNCGQRDLTRRHYDRIVELAGRNVTGGRIELPGGFAVRREYDRLILSQNQDVLQVVTVSPPKTLTIPGQTRFGKYLITAKLAAAEQDALIEMGASLKGEAFGDGKRRLLECFDFEKVKLPLTVRSRQPGDKFVTLGLTGEKKIGKFLTAQRVPHDVREKVLFVEDRGKIIWVWPVRVSEQAKVTPDTRQILKLQITHLDDS